MFNYLNKFIHLLVVANTVWGHGRLLDPPARGTMWRLGFDTPHDYNDHEHYCGGFDRQWTVNGGRCGECGDPYDVERPRPHEAGGMFGTGKLSRVYRQGQVMTSVVHLTANHAGWFEFRLCPTNHRREFAKQSCLNENVLKLADYPGTRYQIKHQNQYVFRIKLLLPKDLNCSHCVLQWHYTTGNNWGICRDGTDKIGCGRQEVFRGCSDVAIFADEDHTYNLFSNLTRELDFSNIIPEENEIYDNSDEEQNEIDEEISENLIDVDGSNEEYLHVDDLDELDVDGDGILNIAGNNLKIETLKKYLRDSGLLDSNGNLGMDVPTDVVVKSKKPVRKPTRSRHKFVTKKDDKIENSHAINSLRKLTEKIEKNSIRRNKYTLSDAFRKSNLSNSNQNREPTKQDARSPVTLGPVIIHKDKRKKIDKRKHVRNERGRIIRKKSSKPLRNLIQSFSSSGRKPNVDIKDQRTQLQHIKHDRGSIRLSNELSFPSNSGTSNNKPSTTQLGVNIRPGITHQSTERDIAGETVNGNNLKPTFIPAEAFSAAQDSGPDMSTAVAFQVRLSRLRQSSTLDKLTKLKKMMRPNYVIEEDPMLLIIM